METIAKNIVEACRTCTQTDPVSIFRELAAKEFIRIHGPEHHILDGACILTAFYNAGGNIDLEAGLNWMVQQGMKMPGAACAHWGVCGAVTSIGAALSFIDGTGPLSVDGTWGNHMKFTSQALAAVGELNGPRCCKRDAFASFEKAVEYIREYYGIILPMEKIVCSFSAENRQCIMERCPYHR